MQAYIQSLVDEEEAKVGGGRGGAGNDDDRNALREYTMFNAAKKSKNKRKLNKLQQRVLDAFVAGICGHKEKKEKDKKNKKNKKRNKSKEGGEETPIGRRRKMPGRTLYSRRIDSLSSCFAAMDRDSDGTVSFNELSRAARRLGLGLSSHDVQVLMSVYDFDRNGELDLEEFVSVSSLSEHALVNSRTARSQATKARDECLDLLGLSGIVPVPRLSQSGSLRWG